MMRCKQARKLFSVYLDEALPLGEAQSFENHLSACDGCRKQLDLWQMAGAGLTTALDADAVPSASLGEFVSACRSGEVERSGRLGRLVEWLAVPGRAVGATAVGSFALTSVLILLVWFGWLAVLPVHGGHPARSVSPQLERMLALADPDWPAEGERQNGF